MPADWWPQIGPLSGVIVIALAAARWVWGIERDMIRRYAQRTAELEKRCAELEEEVDRWREEYYTLRSQRWE